MDPASVGLSTELYTCSFPGSPLVVSISISLVESFQSTVATSNGDRQGILHGQTTGAETIVHSCRAVSLLGMEELGGAIAETADTVGYYRIRDGNSLELTREELDLASALFGKPGSVVLLIERRAVGPAANFFFMSDGVFLNVPLLEFPLDSARLSLRPTRRPRPAVEQPDVPFADPPAAAAAPPAASASSAPPRPPRTDTSGTLPRRWGLRLSIVLIVISLGLVAAAAALYLDRPLGRVINGPGTGSPPREGGTPLRAERQGDDLKIMWDLGSAPVADATSGVLDIDDGGTRRQIRMTADQVRFGSLLYSPLSAQVSVQLTTLKENQTTAQGSVLVLLNKSPQPQPQAKLTPQPQGQAQPQPQVQVQPPAGTIRPNTPAPFEVASVRQLPTRAFVAPPAVKTEAKPVAIPDDLPVLQSTQNRFPAPSPLSSTPIVSPPPAKFPAGDPAKPAEKERLPEPMPPVSARTPLSASNKPAVGEYVGPVLVVQHGIRLPAELPTPVKPLAISVRVEINETGQVMRAAAIAENGVHRLLLRAAEDAAFGCRFRPARQGQRPVQSSLTLVFHAGPEAARRP